MNCHEARALLLDAEPGMLRRRTDPLGAHLATCAACAAIAADILAQDAALDDALGRLSRPRVQRPRARPWKPVAALAPLAAAAGVALLVWSGRSSYPPIVIPAESVPRTTVVNATGTRGVAVMQTRDPDITVIWNY